MTTRSTSCDRRGEATATMYVIIALTLIISQQRPPGTAYGWAPSAFVPRLVPQRTDQRRSCQLFSLSAAQSSGQQIKGHNVVLTPTYDDDSAFDSYRIGGVRVHRTTVGRSVDNDGTTTHYVMWYHGRSLAMNNNTLPPLSTGRIGRAVSKNGLVWEKQRLHLDTGCSASEDVPDVTLGLNRDSWWGFDTTHIGLGNVLLPDRKDTPVVGGETVNGNDDDGNPGGDGGIYFMYYMGGNGEQQPMSDYVNTSTDATLQGMKMRIGVAVSQDGITFGRVEGDDPTGAIVVPFDKSDPNQKRQELKDIDMEEELYCAWPEVVVRRAPAKKQGNEKTPDKFVMYYSTMVKETKQKCIAHAISPDGIRWTKQGICIRPTDESALDSGGCACCCVVKNAVFDNSQWLEYDDSGTADVVDGSGYTMFYEGISRADQKHRILAATSSDGKAWTKTGLVLDIPPEEGAWDAGGVGSPHVIRYVIQLDRLLRSATNWTNIAVCPSIAGNTIIGWTTAAFECIMWGKVSTVALR
jgi:Glycosyl hydrolases family 32 N-terminal domain